MRKYLDIPLTVVVTTVLTIAMLWPLEAPPPAPEGADKLVHFIAFVALAFRCLSNKLSADFMRRL